jgi:hypothetical protein
LGCFVNFSITLVNLSYNITRRAGYWRGRTPDSLPRCYTRAHPTPSRQRLALYPHDSTMNRQPIETVEIHLLLDAIFRHYGYDFRHHTHNAAGLIWGALCTAHLVRSTLYGPPCTVHLVRPTSLKQKSQPRNRPLTTCKNVHFGPPTAPGVFRKIGVSGKNQGVKYAEKSRLTNDGRQRLNQVGQQSHVRMPSAHGFALPDGRATNARISR